MPYGRTCLAGVLECIFLGWHILQDDLPIGRHVLEEDRSYRKTGLIVGMFYRRACFTHGYKSTCFTGAYLTRGCVS